VAAGGDLRSNSGFHSAIRTVTEPIRNRSLG